MNGRIYIFTGKGGVGKTSMSASHALKSAREGKKTILVSTDMAHNLSDLFERKLSIEPVEIEENLDVYEIDPAYVMENEFSDMMASIEKLLPSEMNTPERDEYGMFPGTEELFSLLYIAKLQESGKYERIIVDCAPTGETLALLKFPELFAWYMEKLFPLGKVAMRVIAPVAKSVYKMELPDRAAMNEIQKLYVRLVELQELLRNPQITCIRLVTVPEKMIVEETKRNYMYLNLYNFNVDGLYINRTLPQDIDNPFFNEWKAIQKVQIEELTATFQMLPIYSIPWYDEEVRGLSAVDTICQNCLTNPEIFETGCVTQREEYHKSENGYDLLLSIPGVAKEKVDLYRASTDLVIKIGNFKRNIPLPNALRQYEVKGAKLEEGILKISFESM